MNSCEIGVILGKVLWVYFLIMIVYAVVSWIPSLRGRWTTYVAMLVEPVLQPVRRIIPPVGGLDIAFLIVIIIVQWASGAIVRSACGYY